MKHIKFLFTLVIAALTGVSAWAETFTAPTIEGVSLLYYVSSEPVNANSLGEVSIGERYYEDGSYYYRVAIDKDYSGPVTIPNTVSRTIEGVTYSYKVTSIMQRAFYESSLTQVTFPSTLTLIDNYAFSYCNSLQEVVSEICPYKQHINPNAFTNTSLEDVVLKVPFGQKAYYKTYWWFNYFNEDKAIEIALPGAIFEYEGITYKVLTLPNGTNPGTLQVGRGDADFPAIDQSTEGELVIPATIMVESDGATLPFNVTNIAQYAFKNCNAITQVTIPSTVVNIDTYAFYYCSSLARVNVLATVPPTIQYSSFSKYSALRMIVVPVGCRDAYLNDGVWSEYYTYGNCAFKEIGHESDLFPGESLIRTLPKAQNNEPTVYLMYSVLTSATDEQHGTLQIGNGNNSAYDVSDYNANYNLVLPDTVMIGGKIYDVVRIGANAFSYFSSSSGGGSGELNKSSSDVAENSNGLVSITIPASVTRIDAGAFYNCACLTKVTCLSDVPPFCEEGSTGGSPYVSKSASKSPAKWMKKAVAKLTKGDDEGYSIPTGPFSNIDSSCMLVVPNGKKEAYVGDNWDMAFGRIREKANENVEVAVDDILGATAQIKGQYDSSFSDVDMFVQVTSLNPKTVQLMGKKILEVYDGEYYFYSGRAVNDQQYYNWNQNYSLKISGPVTVMGDEYEVTALGFGSFYDAYYLTSIELPNSIKKIDDWAFEYCTRLSSIDLPSSLTTIGEGAFDDCTALESIEIPDAVTKIGQGAFYYCNNMLSVTLGRGLSEIGAGAFAYCNSLSIMNSYAAVAPTLKTMYVYLDENGDEVEDGEWHPFSWSYPLPTLNVPAASVNDYLAKGWTVYDEETEEGYFSEIVGLANPTLGSEVFFNGVVYNEKDGSYQVTIRGEVTENKTITVIGKPGEGGSNRGPAIDPEGDSYGTLSMPSTVNLVDTIYTITSIGEFAFVGCGNLLGIEIPSTVTEIGDFAFANCDNLTEIVIPDSVTTIGMGAFNDSEYLYIVTLGSGLKKIGAGAFDYCINLEMMYSNATTAPTLITTVDGETWHPFDFQGSNLPKLYVPFGCYSAYSGWGAYFNTIEELPLTVKTVEGVEMKFTALDPENHTIQVYGYYDNNNWPYCFSTINNETTGPVTIPAEVPFNGVTYLVKAISDYAFYNCRKVTSFVIPEGIETIGRYAFYQCDGSKSLVIPNSVTTIGECAFLYWYNVETITIGSGTTSIQSNAFAGCWELSSIYCYAENPPTVGSYAFSNIPSEAVLYVPVGTKAAYDESDLASYFSNGERIVEMGGSELEPGDVSGDGEINVTDVTSLVSIILGNDSSFTPAQLKAADLNNDGEVNVTDVTTLVSKILNQ
ncbi:MAG: leucine-rich repeat protein [Bacteroidaceae bacterium]|nr:leucine-rich repeat protein [Bacteroidaceae bacterium]